MIAALAMAAVLVQSAALSVAEPHGAPVALVAEDDYISLIGDKLAAIVGELEGEATPGATMNKALSSLGERLERTSCRRTKPIRTRSEWSDVTCNAPDVERLFPYYAALRRATTPTEHERHGRRLLQEYEMLLRDASDINLTRPTEVEAPDGVLHLLFPFNAFLRGQSTDSRLYPPPIPRELQTKGPQFSSRPLSHTVAITVTW
jgi:hypothetical protein